MKNYKDMETAAIYQHLNTLRYSARRVEVLIELFHNSAVFLISKMKNDEWKWETNYLREHARCAFGASFTNPISPCIYELLFRKYPALRAYKTRS